MTTTPKKKAEMIFQRHLDVLDKQGNSVNRFVKKQIAKECAKITIDEKLEHTDTIFLRDVRKEIQNL